MQYLIICLISKNIFKKEFICFQFPENISAQKDAWLIGDKFLKEIFYSLPAMKNEKKRTRSPQLYMYEMYNVQGIFPNNFHNIRSTMTRIVNSCVFGLNKYDKLPRFMLMIIDKDLIDFIDCSISGSTITLGMAIEWIIHEIEKFVDRKKNMMRELKPGSVTPGEPKFIWIRAISRPWNNKFTLARAKFNDVLEEILASRRDSYILDASSYIDKANYTRLGDLTVVGREHFWRCVDDKLKKFDKQQISLKPCKSENRSQ